MKDIFLHHDLAQTDLMAEIGHKYCLLVARGQTFEMLAKTPEVLFIILFTYM